MKKSQISGIAVAPQECLCAHPTACTSEVPNLQTLFIQHPAQHGLDLGPENN